MAKAEFELVIRPLTFKLGLVIFCLRHLFSSKTSVQSAKSMIKNQKTSVESVKSVIKNQETSVQSVKSVIKKQRDKPLTRLASLFFEKTILKRLYSFLLLLLSVLSGSLSLFRVLQIGGYHLPTRTHQNLCRRGRRFAYEKKTESSSMHCLFR